MTDQYKVSCRFQIFTIRCSCGCRKPFAMLLISEFQGNVQRFQVSSDQSTFFYICASPTWHVAQQVCVICVDLSHEIPIKYIDVCGCNGKKIWKRSEVILLQAIVHLRVGAPEMSKGVF